MHSLDAIDSINTFKRQQQPAFWCEKSRTWNVFFSKHSKVSGLRGAIAFALSLRVPCEGALLIWQSAVTEVCQMAREFPAMIVAASRSTFKWWIWKERKPFPFLRYCARIWEMAFYFDVSFRLATPRPRSFYRGESQLFRFLSFTWWKSIEMRWYMHHLLVIDILTWFHYRSLQHVDQVKHIK